MYKAQTAVKTADDRVQVTNGCKNGRRSSTRHKRLIKRKTIVYEAQTAVKTTEDRQRRTNACKTSDDRLQGTYGSKNGSRSSTRHKRLKNVQRSSTRNKRLLKQPTIVYKAQTAVKTSDDCIRGTNDSKNVRRSSTRDKRL